MAYSNFSGANLHVGGQSTFYNVSPILPRRRSLTNNCTPLALHAAADEPVALPPVDHRPGLLQHACRRRGPWSDRHCPSRRPLPGVGGTADLLDLREWQAVEAGAVQLCVGPDRSGELPVQRDHRRWLGTFAGGGQVPACTDGDVEGQHHVGGADIRRGLCVGWPPAGDAERDDCAMRHWGEHVPDHCARAGCRASVLRHERRGDQRRGGDAGRIHVRDHYFALEDEERRQHGDDGPGGAGDEQREQC
jgi:hypothetical protein